MVSPRLTAAVSPRHRGFPRWAKWTRKEQAVAAIGASLLMIISFFYLLSNFPSFKDASHIAFSRSQLVDLSILRNAKDRGALCLDGSFPGYHFRKGFGSGSSNWVLHLEGGGWCHTIGACSARKETPLGSSNYMERQVIFSGILSDDPAKNPEFFNWNKVKIRYCDGASFAGHPENEFNNGTDLFFRGQLIWQAVMDELLSIGMSNAKQALLSGCSAGGLATMMHCDDFREQMPKDAIVKCLADASFFINVKDISGRHTMRSFYRDVVHLQGVAKALPIDCITKMDPSLCLFPEQIIKSVKTPIFLVNPAYDFWQIQNVLVPAASAPGRNWLKCRLNIKECGPTEMEVLQGFRNSLLKKVEAFDKHKGWGIFINSCYIHCQTLMETWHSLNSPKIDNKTIAEAVGDWYFRGLVVKHIDGPFPSNPTCYNLDFSRLR